MELKFHRRSARLKNYDYSSFGYYFVTICTNNRNCLFGNIVDGKMILNEFGRIAHDCWMDIPNHSIRVGLDSFAIMPNHVHGIIFINNVRVGHAQPVRQNKFQHMIPNSVGSIINSYKSAVTKICNRKYSNIFNWQRNYYDHIIRNDDDLKRIRRYIDENPQNWQNDRNNPKRILM